MTNLHMLLYMYYHENVPIPIPQTVDATSQQVPR